MVKIQNFGDPQLMSLYDNIIAKHFVAAPMGEFASHFESQIRTEIGSQF